MTSLRLRRPLTPRRLEEPYRRWRVARMVPLVRIGMLAAFLGGVALAAVGRWLDPTAAAFLPSVLISTPGFLLALALTWTSAVLRWLEPTVVVVTGIWGAAIIWGAHRSLDAPELGTTAVLLVILFGLLVFGLRPLLFLPVSFALAAQHIALLLLADGHRIAGGRAFHVVLTVALLVAGQIVGTVGDRTDRTQFRQETLITERTAEVERLLRERTDFFTGLSHEFRTPLASILAYAEMLTDEDRPKPPAWQTRAGRILHGCASQLLGVVEDILEIGRGRAGWGDVATEDVDPAVLLRGLWPSVEALADANGLAADLRLRLPEAAPTVRGDPTRLREAVMNLVSNAVKYTPDDGRVDVTARSTDSEIVIEVSDSGPGIPPALAERIFEPFYRVDGARPQRGQPSSGLGLALVRQIATAHGGTVRLVPDAGPGATFELRLPIVVPDVPGPPGARSGW